MRKIYYIFQIEGALSLCKDISDTAQKARHTSFVPFASQALYRTCRAAQLLVPFQVDRQELHLELRNQQCSRMSGTGPTRTRDILPVLLRPFLPSGAAPCRAAPRRPAPRRASSWPPAWTPKGQPLIRAADTAHHHPDQARCHTHTSSTERSRWSLAAGPASAAAALQSPTPPPPNLGRRVLPVARVRLGVRL